MHHFPWLTVVTFAPLAGAIPLLFFPPRAHNLHRIWGLFVTIATFVLSLGILAGFRTGIPGFQLVDHAVWVRNGQRPQEHAVDYAEYGGIGANAER